MGCGLEPGWDPEGAPSSSGGGGGAIVMQRLWQEQAPPGRALITSDSNVEPGAVLWFNTPRFFSGGRTMFITAKSALNNQLGSIEHYSGNPPAY